MISIEYKNNEIAESALQTSLSKAYDKFCNQSKPETLEVGTRVIWTKRQAATTFRRQATVIYDNISSVLVQFDDSDSPKWVRKKDLTKVIDSV